MTRSRPSSLGRRLMLAITVVLLATVITAGFVAAIIGPVIFHDHMLQSDVEATESALFHAERAFRTAGALSLGIALGVAALVALAASIFITRRISGSLAAVTTAARDVADGIYDAEVHAPAFGAEFEDLAHAFNHMSARLRASESLRRRLLSDVAHELRTPVATMNAYLEGLEDGLVELDEHTVALLRSQAARLTHLAEDLSAVTRAESDETQLARRPEDPRRLLTMAAEATQVAAASAAVTVDVDAPPELPSVDVDAQRMAQVLGNLLDNALRHTPAGGHVTLKGYVDGPDVVMEVQDTGSGIPAEHLPFVFERFYRADLARDRDHGGSGIGLAIVKALVDAHGGTITAHSGGDQHGSRFEVRLPLSRTESR